MLRGSFGPLCLVIVFTFGCGNYSLAQSPQALPDDNNVIAARQLAKEIDRLLHKRSQGKKIQRAAPARDSVYFRRLHLDLAGRIPTLLEIRDFMDDDRADKRVRWVERLLADPGYEYHFANVWQSVLMPNKIDPQGTRMRFDTFYNWLRGQLKKDRRYDEMVREIISGVDTNGNNSGTNEFYTAHGAKPEDMAAATARVFLGVSLECAQCHSHPFAKWTREQFWETAAFFQPPVSGKVKKARPTISIPGTKRTVSARFLDGSAPAQVPLGREKKMMAAWATAPKNPFFAKAAVDHVWTYFFGLSLLDPIQANDEALVTHPELLDLLAREFTAHQYDLKFLMRAIVQTEAYQLSSQSKTGDPDETAFFQRMPVRSLSARQLYDSFLVATEMGRPASASRNFNYSGVPSPRDLFIGKFTDQGKRTEKQTSILQALFLMNGKFLAERISPANNRMIQVLATSPTSHQRRVESLYLLVLARRPSAEEVKQLVPYIERGGVTADRAQALSDIYWALLNSSEFMLNH